MQAPEPASVLYVPAPQGVHGCSPPAPVYPATHWHAPLELLPRTDCVRFGHCVHCRAPAELTNVFAGQSAHPVEPFTSVKLPASHAPHGAVLVVFLYLPTPHAPHSPFSGPEYPALQKQAEDISVLSAGQHTWLSTLLNEHTEQLTFPTAFL